MKLISTTLGAAALALAVFASPAGAHEPGGFGCRYADMRAEHAVCASRPLKRLKGNLSYWYRKAGERARYFGQSRDLHRAQRTWVAKRNRCGSSRVCLWVRYKHRINQLRRYATHV